MAEIINFRRIQDDRARAIRALGDALVARMEALLAAHAIADVAIADYVAAMCASLEGEPRVYDVATLVHIAGSETAMQEIENRFVRVLVNARIIATDFR